jgi:hypothetical protein
LAHQHRSGGAMFDSRCGIGKPSVWIAGRWHIDTAGKLIEAQRNVDWIPRKLPAALLA